MDPGGEGEAFPSELYWAPRPHPGSLSISFKKEPPRDADKSGV